MQKIKQFLFQNTSTKQTFAKNTFWLFFGEMIGRILKLAIVVFATRQLGVAGWGLFSYGLAFVSFFYLLGDLGINTFIIRELSKDAADSRKYLGMSFILKMGILVILFIISIIAGPHIGNIRLGLDLLTILSILYFSDCAREFALSVNRSLGKMEREAFSKILMNIIIMILGILLVIKSATPLSLAIAYAIGSGIATIYVMWAIRGEFRKIEWKFSREGLKTIYTFSWPIIIIGLFSFIFNIDSIMLGQIKSATDVGLYSAAQRIVQFMSIIPAFIAMSIFPTFSKNNTDDIKLITIFEKIMMLVFAIGIPMAIGGLLLSTKIMPFVFGHEYITGGLTLGILMISLLASFPNVILTNVIFSKNLQRTFIIATLMGVFVNIILNFLLIPPYGAIGAAISVTVTQMLIMTINWYKLKKIIPFSVIPKVGKILIASVVMTLFVLLAISLGLHIIVTIIAAMVIYFVSLLILKEPTLGEVLILVKKY